MPNLFDKELERLEREVRDLKTGHIAPVGSLLFNGRSASIKAQTNWYDVVAVIVDIDENENPYPFFQVFVSDADNVEATYTQWSQGGMRLVYYVGINTYSAGTDTFNFKVVCSSAFSLELRIVEGPIS